MIAEVTEADAGYGETASTEVVPWYAKLRKVVKFTYFGAHKGYEAQGEVAFVQYFEEVKSTLGHKDRLG